MRKIAQFIGMAAVAVTTLLAQAPAAQAATVDKDFVGCSRTVAVGKIETPAKFVRVTVTLASDLSQTLATKVVPVRRNGRYAAFVAYPAQARGTHLIVSVGEWDGTSYLRPATLLGADCAGR